MGVAIWNKEVVFEKPTFRLSENKTDFRFEILGKKYDGVPIFRPPAQQTKKLAGGGGDVSWRTLYKK